METDQVAQIQAALSRDLFDAFRFVPPSSEDSIVTFDIDLGLLLDAMAVFQGAPDLDGESLSAPSLSIQVPLEGHEVSLRCVS